MCIELDAIYRSDNIKSPVTNSDDNINNKNLPNNIYMSLF